MNPNLHQFLYNLSPRLWREYKEEEMIKKGTPSTTNKVGTLDDGRGVFIVGEDMLKVGSAKPQLAQLAFAYMGKSNARKIRKRLRELGYTKLASVPSAMLKN